MNDATEKAATAAAGIMAATSLGTWLAQINAAVSIVAGLVAIVAGIYAILHYRALKKSRDQGR